jgi:hypothetical protein
MLPAANLYRLYPLTSTPATSIKNSLCGFSVRVICLASWWQAGILVHYATSHFMEDRSLFVVMSVIFEYIACVCNLGEAYQATFNATGKSAFQCDACAKTLCSSSI